MEDRAISLNAVIDVMHEMWGDSGELLDAIKELPPVNPQVPDQWYELKETITEMRDNDGTGTQQDSCKFLVNYMNVLEKQMQEPKTGHWIKYGKLYQCSECKELSCCQGKFCNECGTKMIEPQESEG